MDGGTFDRLTRHLAVAQSRRRTIRALVGGTVGAGLAAVGLRGAALGQTTTVAPQQEECRNVLERCRRGSQCCDPNETACRRVSRQCEDETFKGEDRCCFTKHQTCSNSCECCRGLFCNPETNTCRED